MRTVVLVVALCAAAAGVPAAEDDLAVPLDEHAAIEHAQALVAKADARAVKQDWDGAEAHYREALAAAPPTAAAWYGLGHVLGMQHRFADARSAFEEALHLEPAHARALERLGEVHVALGRPGEAKAVLERLRPLDASQAATLAHVIATGHGRW